MKTKMKLGLISFLCLIAIFSCSKSDVYQEEFDSNKRSVTRSQTTLSSTDATAKAVEYLRLVDEQYILDLDKESAFNLGISEMDFIRISDEIAGTNVQIRKWQSEGANYHLTDPNEPIMIDEPVSLKLSRENWGPASGQMTTSGTETATSGGWAPGNTSSVNFSCTSKVAPLPHYGVSATSFDIMHSAVGVGVFGVAKVINVPLTVTNTTVKVTFQTTDSNGGACSWSCV